MEIQEGLSGNADSKPRVRFPTLAIEVANLDSENHLHWVCSLLSAASLGRIKLVIGIKIQRSSDKLDVTGLKVFFWETTMVETDVEEGLPPSHLMDKVVYKDGNDIWRECTPSVGLQSLYCFFSQTSDRSTAFVGVTTSGSRHMIEVKFLFLDWQMTDIGTIGYKH